MVQQYSSPTIQVIDNLSTHPEAQQIIQLQLKSKYVVSPHIFTESGKLDALPALCTFQVGQ